MGSVGLEMPQHSGGKEIRTDYFVLTTKKRSQPVPYPEAPAVIGRRNKDTGYQALKDHRAAS